MPSGFTLIEMLVVLMIMGLLVGLVSVSMQPDDRGMLAVEAERLAQLLSLAAQESRLTGKSVRWDAGGKSNADERRAGYRFLHQRTDGSWADIRDNDALRARLLPDGIAIAGLQTGKKRVQGHILLEFAPYGAPSLFSVELSLGKEKTIIASTVLGDVRVVQTAETPGAADASLAQP